MTNVNVFGIIISRSRNGAGKEILRTILNQSISVKISYIIKLLYSETTVYGLTVFYDNEIRSFIRNAAKIIRCL